MNKLLWLFTQTNLHKMIFKFISIIWTFSTAHSAHFILEGLLDNNRKKKYHCLRQLELRNSIRTQTYLTFLYPQSSIHIREGGHSVWYPWGSGMFWFAAQTFCGTSRAQEGKVFIYEQDNVSAFERLLYKYLPMQTIGYLIKWFRST